MGTRKYIHSDSLYLYEPPKCKKCGEYLSEYTEKEYCAMCHKETYQQEYYKKYYERKKQDKEWYEKRKQQNKEYYHKNSKEYVVPNKYYKADEYNCPKKDFDLCCACEKKFRKWLSEKEIPRIEDVLDNFPRWEE